jgi:hypothetical protein
MMKYLVSFLLLTWICLSCSDPNFQINVETESDAPQIQYAISQLKLAVAQETVDYGNKELMISSAIDQKLDPEAFQLQVENGKVQITGGDAAGVMYGMLDIKEQLLHGKKVIESKSKSPRLEFRAIKYNLPWSSYRNSEALSLHTETCRDINYWEAFLDMMAENRFNKLTLWNQHPFSYLVKIEKYPEACSLSDDELVEWEAFWHQLFTMAKDRGIETYLINWNIFVSPDFAKAYGGAEYSIENEYFVEAGDTTELVKDYTRECVKETINKYPNLTGLGITLGEGMGGMTPTEREEWLLESYIEGMRMADRKVKFIHRVPLSANTGSGGSASAEVEHMTRETLDSLKASDGLINIELKFNWSHAHSTPHLAKVHGGELTDAYWNPFPENYRLAWMMRNEDFFMLRWGQTDFIRRHIATNAHDYVNGYFVGSECYLPAKDYFTKLPGTSNTYAFERQWMYYKNWGRLLYDPAEPENIFEEEFATKFPVNGKILFASQQMVSKVPLVLASYWNATWDFTLYAEGMLSRKNGRMTVFPIEDIASKTPMDPAYMSVREFLDGATSGKITPIELADSVEAFCSEALQAVEDIDTQKDVDLLYEVSDIQTWANLGLCFANRLRAAVAYQRYMDFNGAEAKTKAIELMEASLDNWKEVVRITTPIYREVPLVHMNSNDKAPFHWSLMQKDLEKEIEGFRD